MFLMRTERMATSLSTVNCSLSELQSAESAGLIGGTEGAWERWDGARRGQTR